MRTSTTTNVSPSFPHRATSWCEGSSSILGCISIRLRWQPVEPVILKQLANLQPEYISHYHLRAIWVHDQQLTNSLALFPVPWGGPISVPDMMCENAALRGGEVAAKAPGQRGGGPEALGVNRLKRPMPLRLDDGSK